MSNSDAQNSAAKRPYRLNKRAEKQQDTRRRIVEAAVGLHSTLGPARTSVAQIAERAGVQRHTYYAHFPDDRSLYMACSAMALERDPLPDLEDLRQVPAGSERVRLGLERIYGWYERNREMTACVLRDADYHQPTQEAVALRMAPLFAAAGELLGEGLNPRAQALLEVALDFACWRVLGRDHGAKEAAELMSDAVAGAQGDART